MTAVRAVGSMDHAVTWPADDREVRFAAVAGDAPRHDVMNIDAQAIDRFPEAAPAGTLFSLEGSLALGLPLRPVDEIRGGPDALRDAGAGSATLNVTLDGGAAVDAVALRSFVRAPASHTGRLVFRQHRFPALHARRLRGSRTLAAQLVGARPAPASLTVAWCQPALGAQIDGASALFRGAGWATMGSSFNGSTTVGTCLRRVRLVGDLTGLATGRIARDRCRAIGARSYRHRTNMIPDWRSR